MVPDAFCCPILLDVMSDPVFLIETGHTFERSAIEDHLKRCNRGPLCGVQLKSKTLCQTSPCDKQLKPIYPSAVRLLGRLRLNTEPEELAEAHECSWSALSMWAFDTVSKWTHVATVSGANMLAERLRQAQTC